MTPLLDRILIEVQPKKQLEDSKIIIPGEYSVDKYLTGKVISVGAGKYQEGIRIPVCVLEGDVVLFDRDYACNVGEVDGKKRVIVLEEQLIAKL